MFLGYTFILIIDKVMFDTHALFEEEDHDHADLDDEAVNFRDPADKALIRSVRGSIHNNDAVRSGSMASMGQFSEGGTPLTTKEQVEKSMKSYLNKNDRFAERMRASMKSSRRGSMASEKDMQNQRSFSADEMNLKSQHLFVDPTLIEDKKENLLV